MGNFADTKVKRLTLLPLRVSAPIFCFFRWGSLSSPSGSRWLGRASLSPGRLPDGPAPLSSVCRTVVSWFPWSPDAPMLCFCAWKILILCSKLVLGNDSKGQPATISFVNVRSGNVCQRLREGHHGMPRNACPFSDVPPSKFYLGVFGTLPTTGFKGHRKARGASHT